MTIGRRLAALPLLVVVSALGACAFTGARLDVAFSEKAVSGDVPLATLPDLGAGRRPSLPACTVPGAQCP